MQVRVKYEKRFGDTSDPCRATAHVNGYDFNSIGPTWEAAKAELLEHIRDWFAIDVPPPETVELDLSEAAEAQEVCA